MFRDSCSEIHVDKKIDMNDSKIKIQKFKIAAKPQQFKIQNSKFKNHPLTFSTSSMFLSNGPLCSSFSVHMAAANLPASVMLSPCERQ